MSRWDSRASGTTEPLRILCPADVALMVPDDEGKPAPRRVALRMIREAGGWRHMSSWRVSEERFLAWLKNKESVGAANVQTSKVARVGISRSPRAERPQGDAKRSGLLLVRPTQPRTSNKRGGA